MGPLFGISSIVLLSSAVYWVKRWRRHRYLKRLERQKEHERLREEYANHSDNVSFLPKFKASGKTLDDLDKSDNPSIYHLVQARAFSEEFRSTFPLPAMLEDWDGAFGVFLAHISFEFVTVSDLDTLYRGLCIAEFSQGAATDELKKFSSYVAARLLEDDNFTYGRIPRFFYTVADYALNKDASLQLVSFLCEVGRMAAPSATSHWSTTFRLELIEYCTNAIENKLNAVTATSSNILENHKLLGITVGASCEEMRSAYLDKVAQWHPDKLQQMAPELREFATLQLSRINVAYQELTGKAD